MTSNADLGKPIEALAKRQLGLKMMLDTLKAVARVWGWSRNENELLQDYASSRSRHCTA